MNEEPEDILDRHAQRCTITAMQGCPVCMAWADREMKKASPPRRWHRVPARRGRGNTGAGGRR